MIPKIIHYCWFGEAKMPTLLRRCIESWEVHLPDYKIVRWDESNAKFDCDYVERAYNAKKWAFVSDYIRLQVIYEYGGIYLDTDIFLLRSLDNFLTQSCFFVAEHKKSIGLGVFGAVKQDPFIEKCLKEYQNHSGKFIPIPKLVSDAFFEYVGSDVEFSQDLFIKNVAIFEPNYFYALPYEKLFDIHKYRNYLVSNSYGVHLWYGSWHNYNELVLFRRKEFYKGIKALINSFSKVKNWNITHILKVFRAVKDGLTTPNAFK